MALVWLFPKGLAPFLKSLELPILHESDDGELKQRANDIRTIVTKYPLVLQVLDRFVLEPSDSAVDAAGELVRGHGAAIVSPFCTAFVREPCGVDIQIHTH